MGKFSKLLWYIALIFIVCCCIRACNLHSAEKKSQAEQEERQKQIQAAIEDVQKGKEEIEKGHYSKASKMFNKALKEDENNEEAKICLSIIDNYKNAHKEYKSKHLDDAKNIIDNIDSKYNSYAIKEDIDNLRVEIIQAIKKKETPVVNPEVIQEETKESTENSIDNNKQLNKEYVQTISPLSLKISEHWNKIYNIFLDGLSGIKNNRSVVFSSFESIRTYWDELSKINVPNTPEAKKAKTEINNARDLQLKAIKCFERGLDNSDVELIKKAYKYLGESTEILDKRATPLIHSMT